MANDVGYKGLTHADISDYYFPERYVLKPEEVDNPKLIIPPSAN